MTTSMIEVVGFQGDALQAVRKGEKVWVVVKPVCRALGVAEQRQAAKLRDKPWATTTLMVAVAEDGKNRELFCLALDSLPMWLAGIEPSRAKPQARQKLIAYQRECAQVLRDHFFGRGPSFSYENVSQALERVVTRVVEPILERQSEHFLVLMRAIDDRHAARESRLEQRVAELEQGGGRMGAISTQTHNRMRALIRKICEKEVLLKRWASVRGAQRDVYREIGELTGWGGKAQKWGDLPAQWESPVMVALTRRLIDAERHADRLLARQLDMFPKVESGPN